MNTRVSRRAKLHADRAGEPLDGLVNLFDVGIVLAVAFLLAALSALRLTGVLNGHDVAVIQSGAHQQTIIVKQGTQIHVTTLTGKEVVGDGTKVGVVYRLKDGRLVYVAQP
jgi:hypothetical protein